MTSYFPFLLLLAGGSILTIGDIVMKKWVINQHLFIFIIGLFIYLIGLIFLSYSFKFKNIAVASTIFVLCNVITLSLVSWLYFKEPLSSCQIIGIFFGITTILFLEMS